jgi:hypothetical protein
MSTSSESEIHDCPPRRCAYAWRDRGRGYAMSGGTKWRLYALVAVSLVTALDEGVVYWAKSAQGGRADLVFVFAFPLLLALWIDADSRDYPNVRWPFDRGLFIWLYMPLLLPGYLYRTRRACGLALLLGFVALGSLGWFAALAIDLFNAFR